MTLSRSPDGDSSAAVERSQMHRWTAEDIAERDRLAEEYQATLNTAYALMAERDLLREALERIEMLGDAVGTAVPRSLLAGAKRIAREALDA